MSENTWPGGHRHAMHQTDHESWNARHYPGTLQLCSVCDEPTGRCEEDTMWSDSGKPLCEECWKLAEQERAMAESLYEFMRDQT